ncbi:hypothetical protein MTO96_036170 [Rhipicephalus appendiculatus]
METPVLPSQEFSSSQPECEVSPAVLHPEYVAATSAQPSAIQPRTQVIFVMELPTPLLEQCASGHLGLCSSRHRHHDGLLKPSPQPPAAKPVEASTINLPERLWEQPEQHHR